jgi:VIT1/CCC1 family predicted Fe2+/Mn2+ transporter
MSLEDVYKRNLQHRTHRAGWLRAAVLGANDGLVSTASLMIGVAAAGKDEFLLTAGLAGITAGAMSMAVGEYVSVKSQNDVEASDRLLEMEHLAADPEAELMELQHIYIARGLTPELAMQVAQEMHKKDA